MRTITQTYAALAVAIGAGEKMAVFQIAGTQKRRRDTIVARDRANRAANSADRATRESLREASQLRREASAITAHLAELNVEPDEKQQKEIGERISTAERRENFARAQSMNAIEERAKSRRYTMSLGKLPAGDRKLRRTCEKIAASLKTSNA